MQIRFATTKMAKLCNSEKNALRAFGQVGGKRLMLRLEDIASARNLEELKLLPGRAHPMRRGERKNEEQWTMDLDHPQRLVFVPDHDPLPRRGDGGLDLAQVTAVCIVEVGDTHGDP
jgi:toxin HigB-1